jgi:cyanophycinase
LLLFGGGSRPEPAIRRFVEWSGGNSSRILIIGWASSIPQEYARSLESEFFAQGASEISVSAIPPQTPEERAAFLSDLFRSTGVFFTGGNQNRAMGAIDSLGLKSVLRERFRDGVAFAGTSAGTALMAGSMITGEPGRPTAEGLGLFSSAVIDMHFLKRNREGRLLSAMQSAGIRFGIGVEEDGALAITDSETAEVLGGLPVMTYELSSERTLRFELRAGDRFDLIRWRPGP